MIYVSLYIILILGIFLNNIPMYPLNKQLVNFESKISRKICYPRET